MKVKMKVLASYKLIEINIIACTMQGLSDPMIFSAMKGICVEINVLYIVTCVIWRIFI